MRLSGMAASLGTGGRGAVFAGVALFTAVAVVAAGALWRERHLTLKQARDDAAMLSAVMEESTARTFDSVDMALAGLAQHLESSRPARHDAGTRELMHERLRQLPTVRAIFVIGPDGYIQHDTDYPKTPDVSLADRTYFKVFAEQPAVQRHLSQALQSRSGLGWFVAASRRITAPDGRFGGIVVAAVQLDTVARLYLKLGLGEGRQLTLFQRDGLLLARYPDDGHTGRSYADLPVFAQLLPRSPTGVFDTDGPPYSDVRRIVSYRALESQPLVVVVAAKQDAVLAGWSRLATGVSVALMLFGLLTAVSVFAYEQRRLHQRRAQAHSDAAAQATALAERMRALAGELAAADERKTQFLSTLSHELRNVLSPIQVGLAIVERADPASEQARRAWDVVRAQVAQLRLLVDDLMDVARVSSGKVALDLQREDLRDVVAQAAAAAQGAMDKAGHVLSVRLPDEPVWVQVDRRRLLQVMANLLGNAAKYTPSGGGAISVEVRKGARATVEVRDNGLGIPAQDLPEVFGMFKQVDRHRGHSQGGLGIGLALVASLVSLHGGEVAAHSAGEGAGTTFTVSLPLDLGGDTGALPY